MATSAGQYLFRRAQFMRVNKICIPYRKFTVASRTMAAKSTAGEVISETARSEGGPTKGSTSAEMQSQTGKTQNFEQAVQEVGSKMQNDPSSITSKDAAYLKSREARATGQAQPPSDSISAEAECLAAKDEGETNTKPSPADPAAESAAARAENFEAAAGNIAPKMANDPEHVTKEEANLLHSREQRAFGETSKGGIASQAQKLAAENEKKGTI